MKFITDVKEGHLLLKEEPFVFILNSKDRTEHCDNCFADGQLLKCSGCQYVYYCGKVCQKESWPVHKFECKNLKRIAPRVIPDAARLLARLVRKLQNGGDQIKSFYTENKFRMFKDLMSHYPDIKSDEKRSEHFLVLCGVLNTFLDGIKLPNPVELMGIFGRMCINSYTICNQEMQTLGTGMYLGASILDHSCEPNAVATFNGTTLHIRALKDITNFEWSKVFISYVDVLNTPQNRQAELLSTYYFLCQCPSCTELKHFPLMASACCPTGTCNGYVDITHHTTKCNICGKRCNEAFPEEFKEVKEFTEMQLHNMKHIAYLDVCKVCLKRQNNVLHSTNYLRIKTLDLAFESSIDIGSFDDALQFGYELVEGFRLYYGDIHPLMGLLNLKLGKILLYKQETKKSLKYFKEAYRILKITHGETSPIFRKELRPLLEQATIELF